MPQNFQLIFLISLIIFLFVYSLNITFCVIIFLYGRLRYEQSTVHRPQSAINISELLIREKIAVAAAMVAIRMDIDMSRKAYKPPPTAIVSAWQAVMRSDILKRQGRPR